MKTFKSILAVLTLSIFTLINANATYRPLGGITYSFKVATGQQVATLVLKDMEGKAVDFILSNAEGKVVMHRKFEGVVETSAKLDFAALQKGDYTMTLQFEDNRVVRQLEITEAKTVVMKDYQLTSKDMPYQFKLNGKELSLFFNKAAEKVLNITITNEAGEEVYSSRFVSGFKPVKQLDLSLLKSGIYYVHIKGNETNVTETIAL
ncbi:T9SS type A sorting domain-containing protein [Limibacter armeniacum]|uniref:DUF3244 domain-containing protein n=1 Tax=Limibacter armeniacum TaxID=466084 RepID=UPI002FE56776